MTELMKSKTINVSIAASPGAVYEVVSNPENLPRWAAGLGRSLARVNGEWVIETSGGSATVRFAERNSLGVLDHFVKLSSGPEIYVPMRVVPNGAGSEVLFTLFRAPEMSAEQYAEDAGLVEKDLRTLKSILEAV